MSSGTVGIFALKDGDFYATEFPGTTAGLQAAIDYGGGDKVEVYIGPGTLEITTAISVHQNCHLRGSGRGVTTIKRASGSLLTGDAIYTGASLLTTPYGSNGTPATGTANAVSDITIASMTIDGNQSAFGSVNPSTPRHMGILTIWTERLTLLDLDVREYLQTGIQTDACRDVQASNIYLKNNGQYASPSSKNGISFNNTQASAIGDGWAKNFVLTNLVSDTVGDVHIHCGNCLNVVVHGAKTNAGEVVIELEGDTTRMGSTDMTDFIFDGILATGNTGAYFTNNLSASVNLGRVVVSNGIMDASTSGQNAIPVHLTQASASNYIYDVLIDSCVFRNINSSDTSNISFLVLAGASATASTDIIIRGCTFSGLSSSTQTGCHGLNLASSVTRLIVSDCTFRYVPGVGVFAHPGSGQTVRDSIFARIVCDTTNNDGFAFVENNSTSGAIINCLVDACTTIDADRQTGNQCFNVGALSAAGGGSVTYVTFANCIGRKTSGSNPARGINVGVGAGGTTDNISAFGCNFNNLTAPFNLGSGTPTNLHFDTPRGKGTNIASAATITIPTNGDVFHVTGTTNITNGITVRPWDNGRTISLIFDGILTVSDTGTSVLQGDFTSAANDVLQLACDATNWVEVSRN